MSEGDPSSYPPIEPVNFDLIIVGTGLSESVIAAAAAAVGKTVLHLDPNPFYGGHFASLSLHDFTSYLHSSDSAPPSTGASNHVVTPLIQQSLYSHVQVVSFASDNDNFLPPNSRKFNLDLGGPRALFCADKCVGLLLKSGASHYVEFKGIDASFLYEPNGKLVHVPDSRAAIFNDKNLSMIEKRRFMEFFKLIQQHLAASSHNHNTTDADDMVDGCNISDEDLESPFVCFMEKMRLPPKLKSILMYAIAMADYDQENNEFCEDLLKTKDGIERLALYSSSVGKFPNVPGALIYPIYGEGELPQAFCRRAAVKGCIYVLRMPVIALLMDKVTGLYRGVKVASGQDLYCDKLILDPSFTVPSLLPTIPKDYSIERIHISSHKEVKRTVARGICVTGSSIKTDVSNCLVVYPPRSLYPEQYTSVRALQIGSNLAVCPSGIFVLYFCSVCKDADEGKRLLQAAMNALLVLPVARNPNNISSDQSECADIKPIVLWSAIYMQKITAGKFDRISSTPAPDGNLNYDDLLNAAEKLFHQLYPDEEYFPETKTPEESMDDDGISLES